MSTENGGLSVVIHVTDKAGHSLGRAAVTLAGITRQTDQQGDAYFANLTSGRQAVRIMISGAITESSVAVGETGTATAQNFTLVAATSKQQSPLLNLLGVVILLVVLGGGAWYLRAITLKRAVAISLALFLLVTVVILVVGLAF